MIARLPSANSNRPTDYSSRRFDLFLYTNAPFCIIFPCAISRLEILLFVVRDAIFLSGRELVRGLLAADNMWCCVGGGLSVPSSSFLFSQNGAALCARREF